MHLGELARGFSGAFKSLLQISESSVNVQYCVFMV